MKKLILSVLAICSINVAPLVFSAPAYAVSCNGVPTSVDLGCKKVNDGNEAHATPVFSLLLVALNFMAVGVGVVVVGGIVWGSFMYITANGNSGKTQEAAMIIVNSIIGLLLFFLMYAIVNFLVPGGLFT